jgi:hypothetical protein
MKQEVEDQIVKSVLAKYVERSNVGLKKYGTPLTRDDLNLIEWLNHLQEELMDATLYIEKLKAELKPNPCLYLDGCDGERCHNCKTFKQQEQ